MIIWEIYSLEAWIAEHIVPLLENLFHTIGWGGVVVIMALGSANIPIPSEVTMPLSGWLLTPKAQFPALQTFLIAGGWGGAGMSVGFPALVRSGLLRRAPPRREVWQLHHGKKG